MVAHFKGILLAFDISMKMNVTRNAVLRCYEKTDQFFPVLYTHAYACTYTVV